MENIKFMLVLNVTIVFVILCRFFRYKLKTKKYIKKVYHDLLFAHNYHFIGGTFVKIVEYFPPSKWFVGKKRNKRKTNIFVKSTNRWEYKIILNLSNYYLYWTYFNLNLSFFSII